MRHRQGAEAGGGDTRIFNDLGPLQRDIVAGVWMLDEATVKDVQDHLAAHGRDVAYTTVLSTLQKLEKAGWLAHRSRGRTYLYRVLRSRDRERRRSLQRLVNQLFGGDRALLLQQLLADGELSQDEIRTLFRFVGKHERREDNG